MASGESQHTLLFTLLCMYSRTSEVNLVVPCVRVELNHLPSLSDFPLELSRMASPDLLIMT